MPHAVIAAPAFWSAIAGGAATVGAAKLASNASKRGAQAQQRAADQALQYQREQDSYRRSVEDRAWDDYIKRHEAWQQRNFGSVAGAPARGTPTADVRSSPSSAPTRARVVPTPTTLGSMGASPWLGPTSSPSFTLADIGSLRDQGPWSDWGNYGA